MHFHQMIKASYLRVPVNFLLFQMYSFKWKYNLSQKVEKVTLDNGIVLKNFTK